MGLNSETQWYLQTSLELVLNAEGLLKGVIAYCPPDVGAIEAISAIDNMTKNIPKQTARNIQIAPAVPPFVSEKTPDARLHSQVHPRITAYPQSEKKRKLR